MKLYFDRTLLPTPETALHLIGAEEVAVRGLHLSARCPFPDHEDRNPSFSIHRNSGQWKCFGCHRKGGDVLALYMDVTGLSFKDAATALGAWRHA